MYIYNLHIYVYIYIFDIYPNISRLRNASQTECHTLIIPDRQKAEASSRSA